MNVLVSGSSGFIGGYVVEELLSRGHTVVGIASDGDPAPSVRRVRERRRAGGAEGVERTRAPASSYTSTSAENRSATSSALSAPPNR